MALKKGTSNKTMPSSMKMVMEQTNMQKKATEMMVSKISKGKKK